MKITLNKQSTTPSTGFSMLAIHVQTSSQKKSDTFHYAPPRPNPAPPPGIKMCQENEGWLAPQSPAGSLLPILCSFMSSFPILHFWAGNKNSRFPACKAKEGHSLFQQSFQSFKDLFFLLSLREMIWRITEDGYIFWMMGCCCCLAKATWEERVLLHDFAWSLSNWLFALGKAKIYTQHTSPWVKTFIDSLQRVTFSCWKGWYDGNC